jgi:hypothetical protein
VDYGRLDPADGALIAAAPELLAEVRALRARVAELEKAGDDPMPLRGPRLQSSPTECYAVSRALAYWRHAQELVDAHDAWRAIRSKPATETTKGSTK